MVYSYPINLQIKDRICLIVGGGRVAERKAIGLLNCQAKVTIISPDITEALATLVAENKLNFIKRDFACADIENKFIVIAATNNKKLNTQITALAQEKNILVNNIDSPEEGNFALPATLQRGPLQISVSTNGCSPALAKKIKGDLGRLYGEEYQEYLFLLREIREYCLKHISDINKRKEIFNRVIASDLIQLIKEGKTDLIEERVKECML